MRFASLGSGSSGNSLAVTSNETTVLLDCGFSIRETVLRLARLGLAPEQLSGIVLTHEHEDHAGSVFRFASRFRLPIFSTHGTLQALGGIPDGADVKLIDSHTKFSINNLEIHPYPVPHDAREPVQYVFSNGVHRLGVLTDAGASTSHIEAILSACDALVLECNHDLELLMNSSYPNSLKQRISSRLGHLDNATSATLLSRLDNRKLQHLIAAHLSAQNNHPQLARQALSQVLGCEQNWIGVADQQEGLSWREILN